MVSGKAPRTVVRELNYLWGKKGLDGTDPYLTALHDDPKAITVKLRRLGKKAWA